MRQFFAILKDSFREAVDGFVIYLMLALSVLLLVVLASISYHPDTAADALPKAVERFQVIFPDKGKSNAPTGSPIPVEYHATNIQETPNGAQFVLEIANRKTPTEKGEAPPPPEVVQKEAAPVAKKPEKGEVVLPPGRAQKEEAPVAKKKDKELDGFRYAVFAWRQPAGEKIKNPFANAGPGKAKGRVRSELELVLPPMAGPADLQSVTDDEMAAFIKYQFATFVGVDVGKISRRPGTPEGEHAFDVEVSGISGARGWPHSVYVFFGAVPPLKGLPLGQVLYVIEDQLVNGLGAAVTLILSVVITAFFIPNLLRKGSIDLLISKPISRIGLLVYKYVGGLTFIFILSSITIGGVWIVVAIRSGNWNPGFLLVIPVLTFTFAILYSISTVVAVYTRSAIAAILITLGFMFGLYVFGQVKAFFDANKVAAVAELPDWSYTLVDSLNTILPRSKDLDRLTSKLVVDNTMTAGEARLNGLFTEYPSWGGAVGVSLGFIAIMLGLSSIRFVRRDY